MMWKPHEVRRLIAQCAGIALGISGLLLMLEDLGATGLIDVSSVFASGTLSRGSIGLLLLCVSLLLVALPALWGAEPIAGLRDPMRRFRIVATVNALRRFATVTAVAAVLSLILLFGGEFLAVARGSRIAVLLQIGGAALGILSGAMLAFLGFAWVDSANPSGSRDPDEGTEP
jgi:hypothetical protein